MKNLTYCGMLMVCLLVLFVDSSISGIPTTSNVIVKTCVQDGGYVRLILFKYRFNRKSMVESIYF